MNQEDHEKIREAYRAGGKEAGRAMRAELKGPKGEHGGTPKCPTCGSERILRIKPGDKAAKIMAFGIFGLGDVHKIFRCTDCGYKW